MNFEIDAFGTLVIAVLVLLLGSILVEKIPFLKNYNIPEVGSWWFDCCLIILHFIQVL